MKSSWNKQSYNKVVFTLSLTNLKVSQSKVNRGSRIAHVAICAIVLNYKTRKILFPNIKVG